MIEPLSTCVDRDSEIVEHLQAAHQASAMVLVALLETREVAGRREVRTGHAIGLDNDPVRLVTRVLRLAAVGAACVEAAIADPDQPLGPAVRRIDPALRDGL